MSVEIDPVELGFRRPFTVEVAQILKIRNPNTSPVAFKVKTTAPKQYCVRPNSGRIEPGHEVEVSVLLQAMKQEPPLDARCRDKFLVQSVTITGDKEFNNVQQIWDSADRSTVQEKKIRVVWLAPSEDGGHTDPHATPVRRSLANEAESTPDAAPPAYSSPNEESGPSSISKPSFESNVKKEVSPSPEPAAQSSFQAAQAATTAAVASVKATAGESYEQLKEKLAKAEATIASLKNDAVSGLRQRKTTVPDVTAKTAEDTKPQLAQETRRGTEGVPVHVTAILCLCSFLLAYFFF
ncbi:PapD-like protein [Bombardia bombarda]|uniref:PapD-like protein n=1 Tax=Bombardia bombarda TaxID=252184 RepID=A0AA40CEK5_9PEZI|nr:PapD-like protein [Bombardia bombarda]